MAASYSIKQLKAELEKRKIDYTGCTEKSELVRLLEKAGGAGSAAASSGTGGSSGTSDSGAKAAAAATDEAVEPPEPDADMDTVLSQISNLLDTLPASMQLLDKKWSEARQDKVRGQLRTVKGLLDQTATQGTDVPGWQSRMQEYNDLARAYKKIRDMPRNMNG